MHYYQKLYADKKVSKWYLALSIEILISHTSYYYWNLFVKRKDGLLDITNPNSHEIDLRNLAVLKATEAWAVVLKKLHYFVKPTYLKTLVLGWRPRDVKAKIGG